MVVSPDEDAPEAALTEGGGGGGELAAKGGRGRHRSPGRGSEPGEHGLLNSINLGN